MKGVAERDRIRFAARLAMGRQLVDQGAAGSLSATGTAIDALRESATARELDLMTSRFNAQGRANAYKSQGDLEYAKGYSAMVGGIISGAATLAETAQCVRGASGGAGGGGGAG
jgi:hypothetical protein